MPKSIWSIDSIQKVDRRNAVVRFIKYHYPNDYFKINNVEDGHMPGIRYGFIDIEMLNGSPLFQHGNALSINTQWNRHGRRDIFGFHFKDLSEIQHVPDIKNSLRTGIETAIQNASKLRTPVDDIKNVAPINDQDQDPIWARIHVHNIGQGDTIVLELPNDKLWLIDAIFQNKTRRLVFEEWMKTNFPGRGFDRIIVSHMHADHIKSIPWCIAKYARGDILIPLSLKHTSAISALVFQASKSRLKILNGCSVQQIGPITINITNTEDITSINSTVKASKDPNRHEIGVALSTDRTTAFLAGDMPGNFCYNFLKDINALPCETERRYYKVSHHGSKTGYHTQFFKAYNSNHAIISCGKNNRYSHPHSPPLNNLPSPIITWKNKQEVYSYDIL